MMILQRKNYIHILAVTKIFCLERRNFFVIKSTFQIIRGGGWGCDGQLTGHRDGRRPPAHRLRLLHDLVVRDLHGRQTKEPKNELWLAQVGKVQ